MKVGIRNIYPHVDPHAVEFIEYTLNKIETKL